LIQCLADLVASGELTVQQDGEVVIEPEQVRKLLRKALDEQLDQFARCALLVG
jgi:hypothetical protein